MNIDIEIKENNDVELGDILVTKTGVCFLIISDNRHYYALDVATSKIVFYCYETVHDLLCDIAKDNKISRTIKSNMLSIREI